MQGSLLSKEYAARLAGLNHLFPKDLDPVKNVIWEVVGARYLKAVKLSLS